MRKWCVCILMMLLTAAISPAEDEGNRVALVIGNDAYLARPLQNAVSDARAMAKALTASGFKVILKENADKVGMEGAAAELLEAISPRDTVLFFYAGHAVQIEDENVLIPVDFASKTVLEAHFRSFSLAVVFDIMRRSRAKTSIIIVDACRTVPVTQGQQAGLSIPRTESKELYIAFSTSPNHPATDNPDGKNSWFTEALADSIEQPGLTLDDVFTRVRLKVESATGGSQIPWSQTSLTRKFYFHPPVSQDAEKDISIADKWLTDALKHEQYGDWEEAADLLNRIVKMKPGGSTEETAKARLPYVETRYQAEKTFAAGDFKTAASEYEKALTLEPFGTGAAFEAANSSLLAEDLPRTVKALESVRERGTSADVKRADAILKELGVAEPVAQKTLARGLPQPPPIQQIFRGQRFGTPDLQAGQRFSRSVAPVDYAAIAKQLPPPAPPTILAKTIVDPPPPEPPAPTEVAGAPFSLEDLHVEVKSMGSRDLVTEEFGEVIISSERPSITTLLDGKPVARALPYKLKLPAGEYEVRSVEAGKTLQSKTVRVKSGATVPVMFK